MSMKGLLIGLALALVLWAVILAAVFGLTNFGGLLVTLVAAGCVTSFLSFGIIRLAWGFP